MIYRKNKYMSWIKTYEAFIWEGVPSDKNVEEFEKLLKLPKGSGVITAVVFDDKNGDLVLEQPTNLNPMDAGSVLASINREKQAIKKAYKGIKRVVIGDLQISI